MRKKCNLYKIRKEFTFLYTDEGNFIPILDDIIKLIQNKIHVNTLNELENNFKISQSQTKRDLPHEIAQLHDLKSTLTDVSEIGSNMANKISDMIILYHEEIFVKLISLLNYFEYEKIHNISKQCA